MEEKEISVEKVAGNTLYILDNMKPGDKGYDQAIRANDMLLKHHEAILRIETDEYEFDKKMQLEQAKINIEKEKLEFEMKKLDAENAAKEKEFKLKDVENAAKEKEFKLKDVENKVVAFGTATTLALGIANLIYNVWGLNKVGKFEQTGVWRSTASKIFTNKIGKK